MLGEWRSWEGRPSPPARSHADLLASPPAFIPVGAIGSLLATSLAQLPSTQVRLILRHRDYAKTLASPLDRSVPSPPLAAPRVSLRIERDGLTRRTDGLEVELVQSGAYRANPATTGELQHLVRNDPIATLFVTTKAQNTLASLRPLVPRLTGRSTVVLCQNGMGVLEQLLEHLWPDDTSDRVEGEAGVGAAYGAAAAARPSFVCATTTHGVFRKGAATFVHAGMGDLKFGVVPNRAVLAALAATPNSGWGDHADNPLLNPRSLNRPTLDDLPLSSATESLRDTVSSLIQLPLSPEWMPLPTLQIAQLQKLAVNATANALTAVLGVPNGALVGSKTARYLVEAVAAECASVFAAHLAREEGRWEAPPLSAVYDDAQDDSSHQFALLASSLLPPQSSPGARRGGAPHAPAPPLPQSHPLSASSLADHTQRVLFRTSNNLSSTLQDLLAIAPRANGDSPDAPSRTEVAFIHGYLCRLARRYGVFTPVVASLGALVGLKEEVLRSGAVDLVARRRAEAPAPAGGVDEDGEGEGKGPGLRGGRKKGRATLTKYERAEEFGRLRRAYAIRDRELRRERAGENSD